MLKKFLKSFLFEEVEEEIIEEGELEPHFFPKEEMKKTTTKNIIVEEKETGPILTFESDEKIEQVEKRFKSIDLEPKEVVTKKTTPLKPRGKKETDYDVNSMVISPIYGSGTQESQPKQSGSTQKSSKNPLDTVISPLFGAKQLDQNAKEAQERMKEKEEKNKFETVTVDSLDDQMDNYLLEDMLSPTTGDEEDIRQISLFGESDKIIEDTNKYEIEEE